MADSPQSLSDPSAASQEAARPGRFAAGRWAICLLVATVAAWAAVNFTPFRFQLPEHLQGVDMYSPAELQKEAAVVEAQLHWKNSFLELCLLGLCLGAATAFFTGWSVGDRWLVSALVGLVGGVICGAVAVPLGITLRNYLDSGVALPMVDESNRLMVGDAIVYMLTSALLCLPIALAFLVSREEHRLQKALAIVMAGVVAGMLLPVVASLLIPTAQTNLFPPKGPGMTGLWLAVLAGLMFLVTTMTGSRKPKPVAAEGEAA